MIRLENVNKYFNKGKKNELHVIKNTTLEFEKTGLVALLGPSGCGKTTLLNVIGGLDRIQGGKVFIDGQQISGKSSGKIDEIRSRNIGYIFQNYYLVDDMTVFDNVAMVLRMNDIKSKSEIKTKVEYALKLVGMYRYRNRYADMLSGGERQRVGIARALVKDPPIIIADEPTGNLDSRNTIEVMNIIKAISRKRLVILVTHEEELADFYASRIIRLRDGEVIADEENKKTEDLDYRIDNKIYLKDMEKHHDLSGDEFDVGVYSDTDRKIELDIVVREGNVYIRSNNDAERLEIVDDTSGIELVDDHYRGMTQEDFLSQRFDTKKLAPRKMPRYSSIIDTKEMIIGGFRKVRDYKPLKKILLLGFFFSALFIMIGLSNIAGILDIDDSDFIKVNKDYVRVSGAKLKADELKAYEDLDSIKYIIPGDSKINLGMPYDEYLQTQGSKGVLSGSLTDISNIKKSALKYGRMPKNKKEIVVDELVLKRMQKDGTAKQAGFNKVTMFLGKNVELDAANDFIIVGITDKKSPCIYTDPTLFLNIVAKSMSSDQAEMMNEGDMADDSESDIYVDDESGENEDADGAVLADCNDYNFSGGVKPKKDYEVVVSDMNKDTMKVGKKISRKVNGHKLKVVGYYHEGDEDYQTLMLVNSNTFRYSVIENKKGFVAYGPSKAAIKEELSMEDLKVEDPYQQAKNKYVKSKRNSTRSSVITALIILVISLIEIFLIMRASFLSRIKEVGVYRAIGVKKTDIYRMFVGEIIAITVLAGIPGYAFACYVISRLTGNETIAGEYMLTPAVMLAGFAMMFLFNIIFGLLPVARTLRQVPAQILARNDIN